MVTLENERIRLSLGADGREAILEDLRHGCAWKLDPSRQTFFRRLADGKPGLPAPFPAGRVERTGDSLTALYLLPEGAIQVRWELAFDHVRLVLAVSGDAIQIVSAPGVFRPAAGKASILLPPHQGVLYRGGDDPWEDTREGGAHGNFSLSMAAALSDRGALLATAEDLASWQCQFGEDRSGPFFTFQVVRDEAEGWFEREVRLYPVESTVTGVAKRYRARIRERGEFVSWDEKIARKPILRNLFGGLMAFIGYNKAPDIDYAASARRLHTLGFEHVLYYPVRMCNYSLDFLMGGDEPIWLSDEELRRLHEVPGALLAPWGWFIEGLDDGSPRMDRLYRRKADGGTINGWRIEKQQWKTVCIPFQVEESRRRFASDLREMDWIHYDVNATRLGREACHAHDHAPHAGEPLGRRGDVEWTRRLLGPETNGNRIVSSEGFQDRYAGSYDIGTTKLLFDPANRFCTPVPLTMLVLHDSCIHDWWEVYNYNLLPGFPPARTRFGCVGSGDAPRKAAQDALYGSPPNVFPFGRQYAWSDIQSRRTFSFQIGLDDVEVQAALQAALPVARLHGRIGKLEMTGFELLSADGFLQATVFADGTRIVANLGDRPREAPGLGLIPPESWREIRPDGSPASPPGA